MDAQMEKVVVKNEPGKVNFPHKGSNGIISIFETHLEAEAAVKQMQGMGYDMKKQSIIGRDFQTEENIIGYYNTGDRTLYWGKQGAFWGGLWGLLFGSALFIIPGVGPLVIAGSFVPALVGAIEGAVVLGGLSALGAALYSLGIPKDSIVQYEVALKAGKYLMIAHGSPDDLKKAKEVVQNTGAKILADFDSNLIPEKPEAMTH
jgi:hypothetical protein